MTGYTKTEVGKKLFVVEWDLSVDNDEVDGDAFEVADCELLSVQSTLTVVSGSPTPKWYGTNYSDSSVSGWYGKAVSLLTSGGGVSSLRPYDDPLFPPAPTRFVFPRLEGVGDQGSVKVSALFKEI